MKKIILLILLSIALPLKADMIIETLPLKYRSSDEIIPIITPLLEAEAQLTGIRYKLIIKSTPDNIEDIKAILAEIDVDQTQLLVYVSINNQTKDFKGDVSARVTINSGDTRVQVGEPNNNATVSGNIDDKIKYDTRVIESKTRSRIPKIQMMRVSEGLWANIQTGQAIPIASRKRNADGTVTETVIYQQLTSGFRVMPRLSGDVVTLTIRPQQQSPSQTGQTVFQSTQMETTIQGKLGEWMHIGGVGETEQTQSSGLTYRTRVRHQNQDQIWVKVERP